MPHDLLIFLATYKEAENVPGIYRMIRDVAPAAHILFVDDNSPDGTGRIIDDLKSNDDALSVIHRPGKQGVGSAHRDAINWAYDQGFGRLITMDCDLAHTPEYLPQFLDALDGGVVVGTRFHGANSLPGWNLFRRGMTHLGHFLTRILLGLPYDATGAFRCYDLTKIPRQYLELVESDGYSFFFESLNVLHVNDIAVAEVPIHLPARTYGSSKMRLNDILGGFGFLLRHAFTTRLRRSRLRLPDGIANDPDAWDAYWSAKQGTAASGLYDVIAGIYRTWVIKSNLNRVLARTFPPKAKLLHAGCGSGMVDEDVVRQFTVTACDFSPLALKTYKSLHGDAARVVNADLFKTEFEDASFDGLYNLGVMEHFTRDELGRVFDEFHRILQPGGRIVLIWPPVYGFSVFVLKFVHYVLNDILGRNVTLHPPEPSLLKSKADISGLLAEHGFNLEAYEFGPRDLYVQVAVIARKSNA